jgi:hypothetical protein
MQPENFKDDLAWIYSSKSIGYKTEDKLTKTQTTWSPKKQNYESECEPANFTFNEFKILYLVEVFLTREISTSEKIKILKEETNSTSGVCNHFAEILVEELENKHV